MTGATGLLGHFILRDLLGAGRRMVVMLRAPLAESSQRLARLLGNLGVDLAEPIGRGQLVLVEGALPGRLPEPSWGRTDEILSCAASLQLRSNGDGEPYRTNVEGTEALLRWARAHGATRVHAVSTAYVCGNEPVAVREVFHHPEPRFKTHYEHSKWIAEQALADWADGNGNVLTVLRPSMLVGDSGSGYTTQFGGFYQIARLLHALKKRFSRSDNGERTHIPLRLPGHPDDPHNFVPVDFAAEMIVRVVLDRALHGRIYHLTNPDPPTNRRVRDWLEDYFRIDGGEFLGIEDLNGDRNEAENLMWGEAKLLTERIGHNPRFAQDNTRRVMQAAGIRFPELTRERVFRLLDFAAEHGWSERNGRSLF
jgi:nucleoside-diphosphate-sugar epimerase